MDVSKIESEVVNYYKSLYENYNKENLVENEVEVSGEDARSTSAPITLDEIVNTLKDCDDSPPGPDGIPYSFYKSLWNSPEAFIAGTIVLNAWNYTLESGNLAASNKVSFLRLIPKAGKDQSLLTNWRPITLSNRDHKLITKTYAKKLGAAVCQVIRERQTAYLKGRLINDNIWSMLAMINHSNLDETVDGLKVSLDAKKAFNSVEHSYIGKCLIKFGLANFVPTFKIPYSDLRSDILLNGKILQGHKINKCTIVHME